MRTLAARVAGGLLGALTLVLVSGTTALAHPGHAGHPAGPHGPMPHDPAWGGGWAGGMGGPAGAAGTWWLGWLVGILLLAALIAVLVLLLGRRRNEDREDEALAVLRERFARGDIDEAEFDARRSRLTSPER